MPLERGPQEPLNLDMACSVPLEVSAHPLGPKKSSEFSKRTLRQPLPPFGAVRFYVISRNHIPQNLLGKPGKDRGGV